jgi:hypothetical protein
MEPEKGAMLQTSTTTTLMTNSGTPQTTNRRFASPQRRVHPSPAPSRYDSSMYNGIHNAELTHRSADHFQLGKPFRLEHHLHADHPLRHPNAVHWRSAYTVISLHKKYKELMNANGGAMASTMLPNSGAHHHLLESGASSAEDMEKMRLLEEENKQLRAALELKTTELDQKTTELDQKTTVLDQKNQEIEEKNATIEQSQQAVEDMTYQMEETKKSSEALTKKLSESGVDVDGLMTQLAEMEEFRTKLIAKAAARWKNADAHRAFGVWKNNVAETTSNRRLIARFSARWSRSGLHGSFVRWHDLARNEIRNRSIIRKFASRFGKQMETKCFHKWQHLVGESTRLKRLQEKVAKRFLLRHLSSAFHGWYVSFASYSFCFFIYIFFLLF